ncbi:uncharacterized protein LOC143445998 isoform X2 [Clavelina lepadiformis]|uniref:uncharacterized protein LOC143445998 isoform X2 n=1 Tax=Clavelina lepadiformis TaxID=159417 RepID=UPI0040424800
MAMSSDSDDEAPSDISFTKSKQNALKSIKSVKDVLQRDKEEQKMLRQLHEMRNIKQKKQKTISLDILTQADESIKRKQARKRMFEEQHLSPEKEDNAEICEEENDEHEMYTEISKTKRFVKQPDETVANFKERHLYKGRIRRINSKQLKHENFKRFAKVTRR